MDNALEETQPNVHWLRADPTHVASDLEWLTRCRHRLLQKVPRLQPREALELARELSMDEYLRARGPERVANELASAESDPFARLERELTSGSRPSVAHPPGVRPHAAKC